VLHCKGERAGPADKLRLRRYTNFLLAAKKRSNHLLVVLAACRLPPAPLFLYFAESLMSSTMLGIRRWKKEIPFDR